MKIMNTGPKFKYHQRFVLTEIPNLANPMTTKSLDTKFSNIKIVLQISSAKLEMDAQSIYRCFTAV